MSKQGKLGVGMIGTGAVADIHAAAVNQSSAAQLAGVWNRTSATGQEKATQYGCRFYATAAELCDDPKIDAVLVLTNMESHLEYTLMAINAGKHVLVEKPAGSNVQEIIRMQQLAAEKGVKCMPVHNYIYEDGLQRTRQMIQEGKLGQLTQFYMLYNIHHADEIRVRYPGVIRQILTHHSYTMLYLSGQPQTVSCMRFSTNPDFAPQENVAMATIQMEGGHLSHLCASFANDDHAGDAWTCMIKVLGTEGSTRYSYRDWVINERNGPHSQTYYCYPQTIKNTVDHFIEQVVIRDLAPLSTLDDAITCQQVVEACEQSAAEQRHIHIKK